jgi:hypothetical protein
LIDNAKFNTVIELLHIFPDEQTCIEHLEKIRWNGHIISPFDPTSKVYKCEGNTYHCRNTDKKFNVKTATLFDSSKISLQKWFMAIWLITSHKKDISSVQLSKDLGVTQKTAWTMLKTIKQNLIEREK